MKIEEQIRSLKSVANYWYNETKRLKKEINLLQTFKDNARCNYDKCDNKAQHSDGSNLWCSDCWEHLEVIYPDSELI